jgi:hypothetical protein
MVDPANGAPFGEACDPPQVGVGGKFSRARPGMAIYPRIYDSIGGSTDALQSETDPVAAHPFWQLSETPFSYWPA